MRRDWTCLGPGKAHPVALEFVEEGRTGGMTETSFERCRACGQLYLYERFEVSDWSAGRDYNDTSHSWKAIDADEVAAIEQDPNYQPRSKRAYRDDKGWRAG